MIDKIIERLNKEAEEIGEINPNLEDGIAVAIAIVAEFKDNNGWIKCSDRLPENQLRVLVKTDKSPLVVGWLMFGEWYTDFGQGYGRLDVIAWQPLPEPFKESD